MMSRQIPLCKEWLLAGAVPFFSVRVLTGEGGGQTAGGWPFFGIAFLKSLGAYQKGHPQSMTFISPLNHLTALTHLPRTLKWQVKRWA